jgi:hypothetical protein
LISFKDIMEQPQNALMLLNNQLNIRTQFLYSHVQMYTELEREFQIHLQEDFNQLNNIIEWQHQLADPFGMEVIKRFGHKGDTLD